MTERAVITTAQFVYKPIIITFLAMEKVIPFYDNKTSRPMKKFRDRTGFFNFYFLGRGL